MTTGSHEQTHGHSHDHRHAPVRALGIALGLTACVLVLEVAGGLWTGSLALLADAGHMLSDVVSLAIALIAARLALRPPTRERSFGLRRGEVIAAFVNGLTLVAVAVWIVVEALRRLDSDPEILSGGMLAVAGVGLAVNLVSAWTLTRASGESLNVAAARQHVIADALGSVGAIVAAVVLLTTGWTPIDAVVSILIAVLVLAGAWRVMRESTAILLESAPPGVDIAGLERAVLAVAGVENVHDLHVWRITSGFDALSAHVLVGRGEDCHAARLMVEQAIRDVSGITHTTLQVEHARDELVQLDARRRPPRTR